MSEPVRWSGQMPTTRNQQQAPSGGGGNLADILERVLDKGIVIAGDVQINLLDIELLTIKLRLVVASVDRAKEMGIDWWERDPTLSSGHQDLIEENQRLRDRLEALENGRSPRALETDDEDEHEDEHEHEDDAEVEDAEIEDEENVDEDDDEEPPEPVEQRPRPRKRSAGAARRTRS